MFTASSSLFHVVQSMQRCGVQFEICHDHSSAVHTPSNGESREKMLIKLKQTIFCSDFCSVIQLPIAVSN